MVEQSQTKIKIGSEIKQEMFVKRYAPEWDFVDGFCTIDPCDIDL